MSVVGKPNVLVAILFLFEASALLKRVDIPPDFGNKPLCLDGTRYAYAFRQGTGSGAHRWVIHMQGGAWCGTPKECLDRRGTGLGTSGTWGYLEEPDGILSDIPDVNPEMHNWNIVYMPTCDGSSFLSDRSDPLLLNSVPVWMRGHWITEATFSHLLEFKGLKESEVVLLTGCSSGALGAILNVDRLRDMLAWNAPTATVLGLADAGWFVDTPDQILRWQGALAMWNATQWLPERCLAAEGRHISSTARAHMSNSTCTNKTADTEEKKQANTAEDTKKEDDDEEEGGGSCSELRGFESEEMGLWRCFFPRVVARSMKSAIFALQPAYDGWMFGHCNQQGEHSAYMLHRVLWSHSPCFSTGGQDAARGRREEEEEEGEEGARGREDCGGGVVLQDRKAWERGDALLAAAAVELEAGRRGAAAELLDLSRKELARAVQVSLDACKEEYRTMMEENLNNLVNHAQGRSSFFSLVTDEHCVTSYDVPDWLFRGGGEFGEWLQARVREKH